MAWYYINYACGHDGREQIYGPVKNRQWIADRKAKGLCPECREKQFEEEKERMSLEAAEWAKEQGLPPLTGTPKQIAYGETCRKRLLEKIEKEISDEMSLSYTLALSQLTEDLLAETIEVISEKTSAGWWIDSSRVDVHRLLEYEGHKIKKEKASRPTCEAEAEAKSEATVRPENPKTETVAEIRVAGDVLEIVFPEKREDFRKLMREDLKMSWSGTSWQRKITSIRGTIEDRAAESGHRILAAGFPIRIADQSIREKAIRGEYEEECTRWILKKAKGDHVGWFAIWWDRPDDFYEAARKIPGSRWDKPYVVVPPEQFDQVLDFADMYGFRVSKAAQEIVETARKAKEEALVVNPEPTKQKAAMTADVKPPVLEVPEEVGVDDSLRDDN